VFGGLWDFFFFFELAKEAFLFSFFLYCLIFLFLTWTSWTGSPFVFPRNLVVDYKESTGMAIKEISLWKNETLQV